MRRWMWRSLAAIAVVVLAACAAERLMRRPEVLAPAGETLTREEVQDRSNALSVPGAILVVEECEPALLPGRIVIGESGDDAPEAMPAVADVFRVDPESAGGDRLPELLPPPKAVGGALMPRVPAEASPRLDPLTAESLLSLL